MKWTEVQLEWRQTRPSAVVDAFAVLTVALATRLPVTFEHRARSVVERCELCIAQRGRTKAACYGGRSNQVPVRSRRAHPLSLLPVQCKEVAVQGLLRRSKIDLR